MSDKAGRRSSSTTSPECENVIPFDANGDGKLDLFAEPRSGFGAFLRRRSALTSPPAVAAMYELLLPRLARSAPRGLRQRAARLLWLDRVAVVIGEQAIHR